MCEAYQDGGGVCLFGAALDTGNMGVSALSKSILLGLLSRDVQVTLFDYGRGVGTATLCANGRDYSIVRCGAYHTRRFYRQESLWNIRMSCRFLSGINAGAQIIRASKAVLDISGGDSFTDLYGTRRYRAITLPKIIAIEQKVPLVLLPQTYGPFTRAKIERHAGMIVRRAHMAWARDERSFQVLKDMLGDNFDPSRHKVGVDVAFLLPISESVPAVAGILDDWLTDRSVPTVGLNVSGLLFNRPADAAVQYGLKANYRQIMNSFIRRILEESDSRVLLIPHVIAPRGSFESDVDACEKLASAFRVEFPDRIRVVPSLQDPSDIKWVISQCEWFCGTRMHSTIAALSSGVPAAAISYSPKTLGVFETCAQGAHVADPKARSTEEMTEHLWRSWQERDSARKSLHAALPDVMRQAEAQMDSIVAVYAPGQTSRAALVR